MAMKPPRFRLAWVIVAVAISALNFGVIRAVLDQRGFESDLLGLGALPMANILAVGFLVGHWHSGSRRFLLGFEAFGVIALALYIASAYFSPFYLLDPYLELSLQPIRAAIAIDEPVFLPAVISAAIVVLLLLQVIFALIGGFLTRKYRITITRRPDRTAA
jgi:hypothetical protein